MDTVEINRALWFEADGQKQVLQMVIGPLKMDSNTNAWTCECDIPLVMSHSRKAFGEDPLHAMMNALEMCRASINSFCDESQRVWWLERDDKGGI